MRSVIKYILWMIAFLQCMAACRHKDLYEPVPVGDVPVNVIIHWDSVPAAKLTKPRNMTAHWYPEYGNLVSTDMAPDGAKVWLYANAYDAMCMDFNSTTTLSFRTRGARNTFEVYNTLKTGTYNILVPQLPEGEVTVAEAYPHNFYIDSRHQEVDTRVILKDSVHTVHFYPKDVLREFTFMIYDVKGAANMIKNGGAITGMSASYFPETGALAETPSTILFSRVESIPNAQVNSRWTEADKQRFAAKNPHWESADTLVGWTRDWVVGTVSTFGPLIDGQNRFRLTVETSNQADARVYAAWGYWHGQWEDTVAEQIAGAMGQNGTLEEQLAWRERNGGYDIIIYNDHRLIVEKGERPGNEEDEGAFTVGVGGWGDPITVPMGGTDTRATAQPPHTRAMEHTETNLPDFTVNGVHTSAQNEKEMMFKAQYVYKTEPKAGNPGYWTYEPTKYWPEDGRVDFYAYAPAGVKHLTNWLNDDGTNVPTIAYAMPCQPHGNDDLPPVGPGEPDYPNRTRWVQVLEQEDLLVAVETQQLPPPTDKRTMVMNFNHAFSRVDVLARYLNHSTDQRCQVVRVDLRNLYTEGQLTLDPAHITAAGFEPGATLWTNLQTRANYRFRLITEPVPATNNYASLLQTDDMILVMPQTAITGALATTVYVEYDLYLDGKYIKTKAKEFPLPAGFKFEIGRQYQLLLPLD